MLRVRIYLVVALLLLVELAAAATLDDRIVGTWEEYVMDATSRVQFRRDHTMLTTVDSKVMSRGKWHIEGSTLVVDEQWTASPRRPPQRHRATIFELSRDRLVTGLVKPAITFTRVQ